MNQVRRNLLRMTTVPASALIAFAVSLTTVFAYYPYVRSGVPNTTVGSSWSHGSTYGERALDLNVLATAVYSYLENPHATDYLYYEVYDYKVNPSDCPGSRFYLWDHTPSDQYFQYARINYVHLTDHTDKWGRSWNISPGQYENNLYIGYTAASCGAQAHLHVGHMNGDGMSENIAGAVNDSVAYSSLLMYH